VFSLRWILILGSAALVYITVQQYRIESLSHDLDEAKVTTRTLEIEQSISPIAERAMGELHRLEKEQSNEENITTDVHVITYDWMY
jgi:hypothetical protein